MLILKCRAGASNLSICNQSKGGTESEGMVQEVVTIIRGFAAGVNDNIVLH